MRTLIMTLALLASPGLVAAQAVEHEGDPGDGQVIADRTCSACHAIGKDATASPVAEATAFRTLAEETDGNTLRLMGKLDNLEMLDKPETQKHPPVEGVGRQQYRDIVAYIVSVGGPEGGAGGN